MAVTWPLTAAVTWFQNVFINAAVAQANITDPLNDLNTRLTIPASPPMAKMYNSGGQSITSSSTTALTWDTEVFDTVNGHSTSSNTSRYVCQTGYAGYYKVRANAAWTGNATGIRRTLFAVNGTVVDASASNFAGNAASTSVDSETFVFLNVGDYVETMVFQTSGGALTLLTGGAGNTFQSWFEVQWVHP